nr:MAG TPA: hypothetical protein [Caudoviricetes sp.]
MDMNLFLVFAVGKRLKKLNLLILYYRNLYKNLNLYLNFINYLNKT